MSSRFTETEKWKDAWFRKLSVEAKVLFEYLRDNCDIAGFWEIDLELASYFTGIPLESNMQLFNENHAKSIEAAFKELARGYLGGNSHIFIRTFLLHQKNLPLNPENCAHKGIIQRIKSHNSFGEKVLEEIAKQIHSKGLQSPLGIGKGNSNSKKEGVGENNVCVVDHKPGYKYQIGRKGERVYLCQGCLEAIRNAGVMSFGKLTANEIEQIVLKGKSKRERASA